MAPFQSKYLRPDWLPAVALSAALAAAMLAWDPPVGDLAAQVFRTELFQRGGLAIWNGSWYGGHYTLTYSVLFPPLAALLGPRLVGTLAVVASSYLFDRLVRDRWGEAARWATLWFAAGVVTLLADGQLTFALGVAFALASLRALQTNRTPWALLASAACALSSPVAAVSLAGVLLAAALDPAVYLQRISRGWRGEGAQRGAASSFSPRRLSEGQDVTWRKTQPRDGHPLPDRTRGPQRSASQAAWTASVALALVIVPNLAFPEAGQFPFAFSSYVAIPLWCGGALFVTRGLGEEERQLRRVLLAYLLAATVLWLAPNPLGGNAVRLGALFGGPVLAAVVLSYRPRLSAFPTVVLALALAAGLYWQLTASVNQIARSVGDPSTTAAYFTPVAGWLRTHDGRAARIEVPPTANHWEAAYLAPGFELARGWLRQLDTTRDDIFYDDGPLTGNAYRAWLHNNAIRYVALPDAPLDYSSVAESRLILSGPPYLKPRWSDAHWRVYEVRDPAPLVQPLDGGAASVRRVTHSGFALDVTHPGEFLVRVAFTPYWSIAHGHGCLLRHGEWTLARASSAGLFRVAADFSLGRAWNAVTGARKTC
ncbi:MAG TPA: hypothetical protein VFI09_08900 [Solirubrobacterales bacterium]|nr:hypothetical protein [Solirubrobacterales bacterium]